MQVLKFGGTSVADAKNIERVIKITRDAVSRDRTIIVSSAISGCTDSLIKIGELASKRDLAYKSLIGDLEDKHYKLISDLIDVNFTQKAETTTKELFEQLRSICDGVSMLKELTIATQDLIMSFGELLSTQIISEKFHSIGLTHKWVDSRELIRTTSQFSQNVVDMKSTEKSIKKLVDNNSSKLFIMPGFIASDSAGRTTTLGRGGSDYTASIVAVAVNARILEIWTDVNGMMTADPRIVAEAKTIENISYKEALELSHFGAKVVYPPTIQPVVSKGIPIVVKNTFEPENPGTLIENRPPEGLNKIKGISGSNKIALLSMEGSGMVGIPGYSSRLFGALAQKGINIILITQASSVHTMCVAVDEKDAITSKEAIDEVFAYEISLGKVDPLKVETGFSILSLVGDDMKEQSGTSGRMFDALGRAGINIRAIAQGSSEKNVSTVVARDVVEEATRVIHREFFGKKIQQLNIYIAGYGNVGKELVKIIGNQNSFILDKFNTDLKIIGICNSKGYILDSCGIEPNAIESLFQNISSKTFRDFYESIQHSGVNDALFVDCTGSAEVSLVYAELLRCGVSVVTCNKIANSSSLAMYHELRESAKKGASEFLYETNVGAALPIISTIDQLVNSGDKISKIEAVLSGTLNYLFSNYNGSKSFMELVKEAKSSGYTEPDPRLDLSGSDVLRKTLILSREIGLSLEENDIKHIPFISSQIMSGSLENFYEMLQDAEDTFKALYNESAKKGEKLKFIAKIDGGNASIGLESLPSSHPLSQLEGTDNAIIIYSDNYPQPIQIKGAGAGAKQTAAGIFNDIIKVR